MEVIEQRIKEQGDLVRSLKSKNADKDQISAEVATLKALKDELAALNPAGASASSPKAEKPRPKKDDDKKAKGGFTLKNAKVT